MNLFWMCEESDVYGLEASILYVPEEKTLEFHILFINIDISIGIVF